MTTTAHVGSKSFTDQSFEVNILANMAVTTKVQLSAKYI